MRTLEDTGMVFLVITNGFWDKGVDLQKLKRKAIAKGKWPKGAKRIYTAFLVQKDTVIDEEMNMRFTSELAEKTAIFLGNI